MRRAYSRVKTRLFLSYSAVFALLLTAVFAVGYGLFSASITRHKLENHMIVSEQMAQTLNDRFDRPLMMAMQFGLSQWVERMMYVQKSPEDFLSRISALDIRAQIQQIRLMEVSAGLGEQIVLYFSLIDKAVSSYGQTSWRDYTSFYDLRGNTALLDGSLLSTNHQQTLLSNCSMTTEREHRNGFVYLQTLPVADVKGGNVNMLMFLPVHTMAQQAHSYYHDPGIALYFLDESGISTPLDNLEESIGSADVQRLAVLGAKGITFDQETGQYALRLDVPAAKGSVLILLPRGLLWEELSGAIRMFCVLYALVLLLALLFSSLLADRGYRPLQQLITNVSVDIRTPGNGIQQDEYAMIELALRTLSRQNHTMDHLLDEQSEIVNRYALLQALHTPLEAMVDAMHVDLSRIIPHAHYSCFVCARTHEEGRGVMPLLDSHEGLWHMDVQTAEHRLVVVSYPNPEAVGALWEAVDALSPSACLGWSDNHRDVADFRWAYDEAQLALSYHYMFPDRGVIRHASISAREAGRLRLHVTDFAALKWRIEQGDAEAAIAELRQLSRWFIDDKQCSLTDYLRVMNELSLQLHEVMQAAEESVPLDMPPKTEQFVDVPTYINAFAAWLASQMRRASTQDERFASISVRIAAYIQEHLTDANLSQAEVAGALGYTPSYFSRFFQSKFNCTYHEYVTKYRIDLAKDLMKSTDAPISEIAQRVGFASHATFRRTFRAIQGVSPSEYLRARNATGEKRREK